MAENDSPWKELIDQRTRQAQELNLRARKLDGEDIRLWYRLLDWLLDLPPEYEQRLGQELDRIEKTKWPKTKRNRPFRSQKGAKPSDEVGSRKDVSDEVGVHEV